MKTLFMLALFCPSVEEMLGTSTIMGETCKPCDEGGVYP